MRVTEIDISKTGRGARLTSAVIWDDRRRGTDRIEFLYRATAVDAVATPGDALFAAAFPLAISLDEDLVIDVPVSRKLLDAAPAIADYYVRWGPPSWRRSEVDAVAIDRSSLRPTEVAAAFSGGVDSFYTVLRKRDQEITLLLTMLGFDYPELIPRLEPRLRSLARAADRMGKKHIIVESNAFLLELKYLPWIAQRGATTYRPLIIAQALGLGAAVRRFYIAADREHEPTADDLHPELDPKWSTEAVDVSFDGMAERLEKVRVIASSPVVRESLHVCTARRGDPNNCGKCEKCVETALAFQLAGAINECRTLTPVTAAVIRRTKISPDWVHAFQQLLVETPNAKLRQAIRIALVKAKLRRPKRWIGGMLRRVGFRRGRPI